MGFKSLSEYSNGNLPKVYSCNSYTICENIESFKPFDVSGLKSAINQKTEEMQTALSNRQRSIMSNINSLSTEWGTKYISINGNDLNIVNSNYCSEKVKDIGKNADSQVENIDALVSDIVSLTESVNEYIEKIVNNNNKYKEKLDEKAKLKKSYDDTSDEIQKEYKKEKPNAGRISSLNTQLRELYSKMVDVDAEIKKYEKNKIDEPEGSWVVG